MALVFLCILLFPLRAARAAVPDAFAALARLEIARPLPAVIQATAMPVPNTDLTDPGKLLYSFPSEDPGVPHLVTMRDGKVEAVQLIIPAGERRRYQEILFTNRYDRVRIRQEAQETAYFLPSMGASLVVDTVMGDVLRIEKTARIDSTASSVPETPRATKLLAYAVIGLSLTALALLLVALGIEAARWQPKDEGESVAIEPSVTQY